MSPFNLLAAGTKDVAGIRSIQNVATENLFNYNSKNRQADVHDPAVIF